MRNIILILLVIIFETFNINAQNDKRIKKGGKIIEIDCKTRAEKPIGKSVTVTFDNFFKNYKIIYIDAQSKKNTMNFEVDPLEKGDNAYKCKGGRFAILEGNSFVSIMNLSLESQNRKDYLITGIH